jgi:hypothetical protein
MRREQWFWRLIWAGLLLWNLAACQPIQVEPTAGPEQVDLMANLSEVEQELVKRASAELAQELGVGGDQVKLVAVEAVEWPDASLGCPEPGMAYAQILTSGYRITLQAQGAEYLFHTNDRPDSPLTRCPTE